MSPRRASTSAPKTRSTPSWTRPPPTGSPQVRRALHVGRLPRAVRRVAPAHVPHRGLVQARRHRERDRRRTCHRVPRATCYGNIRSRDRTVDVDGIGDRQLVGEEQRLTRAWHVHASDHQRRAEQQLPSRSAASRSSGFPCSCTTCSSLRSSCGMRSSTHRSAATCSPPVAILMRPDAPAFGPIPWSGHHWSPLR